MTDFVQGLHAGAVEWFRAENARLKLMVEGLAARVAEQSELLSRNAEKQRKGDAVGECGTEGCDNGWIRCSSWRPCEKCMDEANGR